MKTANFLMITAALFTAIAINANAQGRGHHKGHDRHEHHGRNQNKHHGRGDHHHGSHHHDAHHSHDRHHHHHDRHVVRHVYHHEHSHHCGHRVVVHHYERPRYVYYRDYDVYYDCHRNVYIAYSGRGWTISASVPVVMHRVDIHRATRVEVDYYEDDFPQYLEHGRPMYRSVTVGW